MRRESRTRTSAGRRCQEEASHRRCARGRPRSASTRASEVPMLPHHAALCRATLDGLLPVWVCMCARACVHQRARTNSGTPLPAASTNAAATRVLTVGLRRRSRSDDSGALCRSLRACTAVACCSGTCSTPVSADARRNREPKKTSGGGPQRTRVCRRQCADRRRRTRTAQRFESDAT